MRSGLSALLLLLLPLTFGASAPDEAALSRYEFSRFEMGTIFRIVLYAPSQSQARDAARAAFKRIENLNNVLSDYRDDSELRRLCERAGAGPQPVSEDLYSILERSIEFSKLTGGAFDITVSPLIELWREARRSKQLPAQDAIAQAGALVGFEKLRLNPDKQTAELMLAGMKLDLGGIGKGFAADEALKVLEQWGLHSALIDAGGDITLGERPPGAEGWRIAVQDGAQSSIGGDHEDEIVVLYNSAIATSGDTQQFLEIGDIRYSHIVDPDNGFALNRSASVTVIAANGTTADAFATALSVLPPEKGMKIIDSMKMEKVAARVVQRTRGRLEYFYSQNWRKSDE
ncbi:MAG: FAD:protein FMN transferase [Acidobacteriota bacterium]